MDKIVFRKIKPEDNFKIAAIIRGCLKEFGVDKPGTVYTDPATDNLYEQYLVNGSVYYILTDNEEVIGGAGIAPLKGAEDICELQKLYLKKSIRGKGYGKQLMEASLAFAREYGYKKCYLESMPELSDAIKLYEHFNFRNIDKPLGDTGHYACSIRMIKDLNSL